MASTSLSDFLANVDADQGVIRDQPFVQKAIDILAANYITLPFELASFSPDSCEEGAVPRGGAMRTCISFGS